MDIFRSVSGRDSFLQSRCPRDSRWQLSYIRCLEAATFKRASLHELQLPEDKNAPRAANYDATESGCRSLLRTILRVLHTILLLVFSSSLYHSALPRRLLFLSYDEQVASTRFDTLMSRELITYGREKGGRERKRDSRLEICIYHT